MRRCNSSNNDTQNSLYAAMHTLCGPCSSRLAIAASLLWCLINVAIRPTPFRLRPAGCQMDTHHPRTVPLTYDHVESELLRRSSTMVFHARRPSTGVEGCNQLPARILNSMHNGSRVAGGNVPGDTGGARKRHVRGQAGLFCSTSLGRTCRVRKTHRDAPPKAAEMARSSR